MTDGWIYINECGGRVYIYLYIYMIKNRFLLCHRVQTPPVRPNIAFKIENSSSDIEPLFGLKLIPLAFLKAKRKQIINSEKKETELFLSDRDGHNSVVI